MSRHRRPVPHPPPLARLNAWLNTPVRVGVIGCVAFSVTTFGVAGIATHHAPVAKASPAVTWERVQEPTGRGGGPVAPIFDGDLTAPHYEPTAPPTAAVAAQPAAPSPTVAPRACRCTPRTPAAPSEAPTVVAAAPTTTPRPEPDPVAPVVGLPPVTEPELQPVPVPVAEPAKEPTAADPTDPVDRPEQDPPTPVIEEEEPAIQEEATP